MKTIVNGLAVEYSDQGEGLVILMLHGWADTMHTFDVVVRELTLFRIIRLDLPGFGKSERPHDIWGVGEYATFVHDFLAKIQVRSYVLIGHSFGGRIAIKGVGTGVLEPEKLILIASAGIAKERGFKNEMLRIVAKGGKALSLIPPFSAYRQQMRKRLYQSIGSDYFAAGSMRDIFLKVVGEDLLPYAANINIPTLMIWGRKDGSTPLSDGERIHAAIKGSHINIIDGASHFVHQENPEEVSRLMREFI